MAPAFLKAASKDREIDEGCIPFQILRAVADMVDLGEGSKPKGWKPIVIDGGKKSD